MPIAQEHGYGCAVACVAEILNLTYQQALALFPNGEWKAANEGFYLNEICEVLRSRGLDSYWVYMQPHFSPMVNKLETIAFIPKGPLYPAGHYVVRDRPGVWRNSWMNFPSWPPKAGSHTSLPVSPEYLIFNSRPRK